MIEIIKNNFVVTCLTIISIVSLLTDNEGYILIWLGYGVYRLLVDDY